MSDTEALVDVDEAGEIGRAGPSAKRYSALALGMMSIGVIAAAVMSNVGRRPAITSQGLQTQVLDSIPAIELRSTSDYVLTYADFGTGSDRDFAVRKPKLFYDEFRIMYIARASWDPIDGHVMTHVVKSSSGGALAPPAYFKSVWNDEGSGGTTDGSMWEAVAPPGYTCLSDVAFHIYNGESEPGTTLEADKVDPQFRCVHNSLVERTELGGQIWRDAGSGAKHSGVAWAIKGSDGFRVSRDYIHWEDDHYEQKKLKGFVGGLYRDLVFLRSLDNSDYDFAQPDMHFAITRGLTQTAGASLQLTAGMEYSISETASAGVTGTAVTASASLTETLKATFGVSTTFSQSDTSTETETLTIGVKVPARTVASVYQLIVKDDPGTGPGNFQIQSGRYKIFYCPPDCNP